MQIREETLTDTLFTESLGHGVGTESKAPVEKAKNKLCKRTPSVEQGLVQEHVTPPTYLHKTMKHLHT